LCSHNTFKYTWKHLTFFPKPSHSTSLSLAHLDDVYVSIDYCIFAGKDRLVKQKREAFLGRGHQGSAGVVETWERRGKKKCCVAMYRKFVIFIINTSTSQQCKHVVGIGKQGERKRIVQAEWVLYKHYEWSWPWLVLHNHWSRNVNNKINDAKWNQSKQSYYSHAIPPIAEALCLPICAKIVSLTYTKSDEGCLCSIFKWKHAVLFLKTKELRWILHRQLPSKTEFKDHPN